MEIQEHKTTHHRKTSPDQLFSLQRKSSKLRVFSISRKTLETFKITFHIPYGMGFFHVEKSLYLGGGVAPNYPKYLYFSKCRKALSNGEVTELKEMPNSKSNFAMALWKERSALFTVGGVKNWLPMNEIQEYSLTRDTWKLHS